MGGRFLRPPDARVARRFTNHLPLAPGRSNPEQARGSNDDRRRIPLTPPKSGCFSRARLGNGRRPPDTRAPQETDQPKDCERLTGKVGGIGFDGVHRLRKCGRYARSRMCGRHLGKIGLVYYGVELPGGAVCENLSNSSFNNHSWLQMFKSDT